MDRAETNSVISAFSEEQVAKLTGLTVHQLRHWDRTGFYSPAYADENRRAPFSRIYSFKDLVSLQILRALRNDLGCSLQHLREVKQKLEHLGDDKWSRTTLYVLRRKVVFHDSETGELREPVSGQAVFQLPLQVAKANMEGAVRNLRSRDRAKIGTIEQHRRVAHNAFVIGGTRIPVEAIKSFHRAGYTIEGILAEYPDITREDVEAAIAHREKGAVA